GAPAVPPPPGAGSGAPAVPPPPGAAAPAAGGAGGFATMSEDLPRLRKELNTLVSMTAARTGRPHGQIHNEIRARCGGPPTAMCTAEQLRKRISVLRSW
ncbi:MAG: hypothetical protein Q4P43_10970, partial [Corynebacterium sphenisci]|nr:hypothetical protein [Corynebacterium sphenisci]